MRTTRRSTLGLLLVCGLAASIATPTGQNRGNTRSEGDGGEVGELRDIALRRLQALHDMYAGDDAKAAYDKQRLVPEKGGRRPPRPIPLNFGDRDPNDRLRQLQVRAERGVLPGTAKPVPGAGAVKPGTAKAAVAAWKNLGPTNVAGRVSAVAVHPTNPLIVYRGTAGGGVWKSIDGGKTWKVITDNLGNLSIGAIAIAPSAPTTVYVGTGEGALSVDGIDGIGFLKSTDEGATWSLPVSVSAPKFFTLSVHPANPQEILAGTSTGIQKSTDGGATWTTTFSDFAGTELARVPGTPATVLATTWDIKNSNSTWGGHVHRSTDGGNTWTKVGGPSVTGFDPDTGRMSLAISPSSPQTAYLLAAAASMDTKNCPTDPVDQIGVFQSTDGGLTWTPKSNPISGTCLTGFNSILGGQGWYANTLRVDPANANIVYAAGLDLWKSADGGQTWTKKSRWDVNPGSSRYVHADIHELTFAGQRLLIGNDGGIGVSTDRAETFATLDTGVVTRQYYSIAITPASPPLIIAGAQDNGTDIRISATTTYRDVIGGDGFAVAAHPTNAKTLYGTLYESRVFRSKDGDTFDEITPNYADSENRPFISPLTMDPVDPTKLYTGTNFLWRTTNGGNNWQRTSNVDMGDGGSRGYVTKIAVARGNTAHLVVGTGSGNVRRSTDGGTTWTALTGLPVRYVSHVEFDPVDVGTFYVSFISSGTGGRLFKTTDGGASFTRIDQGLPGFPIHVLRVDPKNRQTLYVGTDVGLFRSTDGGVSWGGVGAGLPSVSVWDLVITGNGAIRAATHGRGIFELPPPVAPPAPPPPAPTVQPQSQPKPQS